MNVSENQILQSILGEMNNERHRIGNKQYNYEFNGIYYIHDISYPRCSCSRS